MRMVESERRAALEEAMKRKQIVKRLHERELELRSEEVLTVEHKNADEIASGRAALRGRRKPEG